ncbi:putative polybromo-1 [Talaromyces proteolyticus]|uniref:Polybromo-1 n=1 Tax=Talaromyces proteolyticus TaxID=1131652 RepID=A0AAD4KUJ6_9EURO|nr:putative polybromo-1 [Talaromyces proteolyticus]KAH8701158.1 putative polybromo-1 [Talaromyces proteolyticus]
MSAKRRVASLGSLELSTNGPKRRKVSGEETNDVETPQTTTEAGLKVLAHIKQSTDKNGRLIATHFLNLPDKKRHADYYKVTTLPIALETVEAKLNNHEYPNLSAVEGDLKRMITNAKRYNDKNSVIFADAERVRKMLSNTMPKINPAYKDPKYVAVPTPLPEEVSQHDEPAHVDSDNDQGAEDDASPEVAEGDNQQSESFVGDGIQQAQDKIISEMIRLKDDEGREVGSPFINKPDRALYKDYYEIIQHPVSLRSILKQVRGIEGRKPHSRKTAFPTWKLFSSEVQFVWRNAREFNEDDSEIVIFANYLENYFNGRVAEAKSVVPDSKEVDANDANPRIKLKLGSSKTPEPSAQKLKLKFPGQRPSSAEEKTHASDSIDSDSAHDQQDLAPATSPATRGVPRSTLAQSMLDASNLDSRLPIPSRDESPMFANSTPQSLPLANANTLHPSTSFSNAWPHLMKPLAQNQPSHSSVESILREPNQEISDALIKELAIKTHPSLGLQNNFSLNIPASAVVRQQSFVINLPVSHNLLSLSLKTVGNTPERRTRLVALAGPHRTPLAPQAYSVSTNPIYDIRLSPGLTKIDFQIISQRLTDQEPGHTSEPKKEFERLTVFFRLLH